MPTKRRGTTRRAISVKGITYQRARDFCDQHDRSVSGLVEELLARYLDDLGVPVPDYVRPPEIKDKTPDEIISQHFTF